MPLVHAQEVTPDDAIASAFCPECGHDLTLGNPAAHRKTHWMAPPPADASGDEARRRMGLFDEYIKAHAEQPAAAVPAPASAAKLRAEQGAAKA